MAVYYKLTNEEQKNVYGTAKIWKKKCLLDDQSLIWDGEYIWTHENIDRFRAIFIEDPDISGESFTDKLKKQLQNESEDVYKFVIEMLYIYYMYPVKKSIGFETKMNRLETIASWKGLTFDRLQSIFDGLKIGLGSTGTYFNTNIYLEISYLFYFVQQLKNQPMDQRKTVLEDRFKLKELAENVRNQVGKRVQIQHILLHLLLPDYFERISSWGHKTKIVKAFNEMLGDDEITDIDESLYYIRKHLERTYGTKQIDFYDTEDIRIQWFGPVNQQPTTYKNTSTKELSENTDSIKEDSMPIIPSVNFDQKPQMNALIFENTDILMDQIMTALSAGKHIILTGPPGTGKSKLASLVSDMYQVTPMMVTASSNWSTYETIGGYRPDREGDLYFDQGIFLQCVKEQDTNYPKNNWLIIDEINRADIDKAFGSLFSVLTGDEVTLPFTSETGESIRLKPQGDDTTAELDDHTYVIPKDWRIIATMNTIDKASLYEMSYAFMRRFAFIPVGIPKTINNDLIEKYLEVWNMPTYPNVEVLTSIWQLINQYRKIGPAIVEDLAKHTQNNDDFTSAIILYVLPQFEGMSIHRIKTFVTQLVEKTDAIINTEHLNDFVEDFFGMGEFE